MENQTNEKPNINLGKILTGVFALVSCAIVFFFNIDVFVYMGYWYVYGTSLLIFEIIKLLILLASLVFIILNIRSLISKDDKRSIFKFTSIIEVVFSLFIFLYSFSLNLSTALSSKYSLFYFPTSSFLQLILCIGILVGGIVCNKKFPSESDIKKLSTVGGNAQEGYYQLSTHIILMIFLGGIWQIIWIHRTNKYLNSHSGFNRNPTTSVLLCLFVPFYIIYWMYKAAQEIDKLGASYNREQIATVCLICEFFFAIASPIIMQKKINDIIDFENGNLVVASSYPAAKPAEADKPAVNTADELNKYKQLLDSGAITQEEYNAVKSEYLKKFTNKE